jgi:hypothetical protein
MYSGYGSEKKPGNMESAITTIVLAPPREAQIGLRPRLLQLLEGFVSKAIASPSATTDAASRGRALRAAERALPPVLRGVFRASDLLGDGVFEWLVTLRPSRRVSGALVLASLRRGTGEPIGGLSGANSALKGRHRASANSGAGTAPPRRDPLPVRALIVPALIFMETSSDCLAEARAIKAHAGRFVLALAFGM